MKKESFFFNFFLKYIKKKKILLLFNLESYLYNNCILFNLILNYANLFAPLFADFALANKFRKSLPRDVLNGKAMGPILLMLEGLLLCFNIISCISFLFDE